MENTATAPVSYHKANDKYIVSIDASALDHERFLQMLEVIRLEILGRKIAFDPSLEELGEQIKADWWAKNKDRL